MSQENRDVFECCIEVADELVDDHRHREAWAVLSALQAYLDPLPAYSDGSCRKMTERRLQDLSVVIRSSDDGWRKSER